MEPGVRAHVCHALEPEAGEHTLAWRVALCDAGPGVRAAEQSGVLDERLAREGRVAMARVAAVEPVPRTKFFASFPNQIDAPINLSYSHTPKTRSSSRSRRSRATLSTVAVSMSR